MRALKLILAVAAAASLLSACWVDQITLAPTSVNTSVPTSTPQLVKPSPTFVPATDAATPFTPATETPTPNNAAGFPDPSAFQWELVASGLERPVDIRNAADGSGRLFVIEKPGRIRIIKDDVLVSEPFLDILGEVRSSGNEQGLLGLVFHPQYNDNGYFYVNYINKNGDTIIARFKVSADPNIADPNSEQKLLEVAQPYPNHNGGSLAFGPDGYLYIGLGDGGSKGDPNGNGQSLNALLGKILRIDVDHGDPYAIPVDNPYVGSGEVYQEIWASGLRNPWRFAFDPVTGDLFIGEVGQNKYEEIDIAPRGMGGLNFGWNYREGLHPYAGNPPAGGVLTDPVFEYAHGPGCSVTGGLIYRGAALPVFAGIYLFGDYCSGQVWGLLNLNGSWQAQQLFSYVGAITTFGVDEAGEVYLASDSGEIYRLAQK